MKGALNQFSRFTARVHSGIVMCLGSFMREFENTGFMIATVVQDERGNG